VRFLFVKRTLAWPRASGHDVHAFHMMAALAALGHDIGLATPEPTLDAAVGGLPLALRVVLKDVTYEKPNGEPWLTGLQERFRSYWGIPEEWLRSLGHTAKEFQPDAVVAVGLDALPYLPRVPGVRIWYAADEWILHHLSLCRAGDGEILTNLKTAAIKGLYERAFARDIDRAWVVSGSEAVAMRWLAGVRHVDVLPNGVDAEFFNPRPGLEQDRSAVFWGRLDFEPNIHALKWFCGRVWPLVRREDDRAQFTIIGFNPSPDLRDLVARRSLVVLPLVSGGGIKNKLLEAASMGKAIVCTPRACSGLKLPSSSPPMTVVQSVDEWCAALKGLWNNPQQRTALGSAARAWVSAHHTWDATAQQAIRAIQSK
jgi:glycosyltransferase involved in cell wall biosynthesis